MALVKSGLDRGRRPRPVHLQFIIHKSQADPEEDLSAAGAALNLSSTPTVSLGDPVPCPLATVLPFQQPSPFCHPERTRVSYLTDLTRAACVVLSKENHMRLTEAATCDRKSGEAEGSAVRPGSHPDAEEQSARENPDLLPHEIACAFPQRKPSRSWSPSAVML